MSARVAMTTEPLPLPPALATITRPNIRITNVSVTRLSFRPQDGSFVHECGPVVLTKYDVAVIEIHTDAGLVGIGPGNPHDEADLSQFVGRNPFDLLSQRAPAGVNVACWDIVGKALGQPVFRLLAGDRPVDPNVKVYASGGENALHAHKAEDHAFIVLQGKATFSFGDGSTRMVRAHEGVMIPKGVEYKFEADAAENLVLLRVGGGQRITKGLDDLTPFGAPRDINGQTVFADGSTKIGHDPRNGESSKTRVYAKDKYFAPD